MDFNICPSCGVEFGYETAGRKFHELRQEWVETGARWASKVDKPPGNWNPWLQLIEAGLIYSIPFHVKFHTWQANSAHGKMTIAKLPLPVMTVKSA